MLNEKYKCLICDIEILKDKTYRKIYLHIKNEHNLNSKEYKEKFNLGPGLKENKKCKKCKKIIIAKSKSGMCKKCNDKFGRIGILNPFYGKSHSEKIMNIIKTKNSIAIKKKWKDSDYRNKIIKGISKPRSKISKQNISKGVKESYNKFPNLRKERSLSMLKRIDKGYDPTHKKLKNEFSSINCGYGFSGFYKEIFFASKLELKRMKFLNENNIFFERYNNKIIGNIKYFDKKIEKYRNYFPDLYIKNYNMIEEIKYEHNITDLVLKKYFEAYNFLKNKNIKYYIVTLKEINLLPNIAYNSNLNKLIRNNLKLGEF